MLSLTTAVTAKPWETQVSLRYWERPLPFYTALSFDWTCTINYMYVFVSLLVTMAFLKLGMTKMQLPDISLQ